jgi:mRNA interferase HigB
MSSGSGRCVVKIGNQRVVKQFIAEHPDSESPVKTWLRKTRDVTWGNPAEVKTTFNSADHLGDNKWIFNIGGGNYRLAAMVWISNDLVYVLKIMTHAEYDKETF